MNKVVQEKISTKISEEVETMLEIETEFLKPSLLAHQLNVEESSKETCEEKKSIQLDEKLAKEKPEVMSSDENLSKKENETIVINENETLNRGNENNKVNASILLDMKSTKDSTNDCNVSADSQNITQSTAKENDETTAHISNTVAIIVDESIPNIVQETLQKSVEIIECNILNNTNIIKNKTDQVTDQATKVDINNSRIQVNNSSLQKQEYDRTSLNIIAVEYGNTDSDLEEEIEADIKTENHTVPLIQIQNSQQYRTIVEESLSCEEIDSEDDSSSSSNSSSSTSSSSSSSDNNSSDSGSDSDSDIIEISKKNNMKNEGTANTAKKGKQIKSRNELDDLPPIEDLQISIPEVLCNPLGEIKDIVEQLVIVKPKPSEPTLNLDTVLFINRGKKALGKIFDVFGPVNEPYYCIRFNDNKHIQDNGIKVGIQVYYCPNNTSYTSVVFLHELTKLKGCDAVGDDEAPAFSDDEKEQAYYEKLKQKNNKDCPDGNALQKRQHHMGSCFQPRRGRQPNRSWNRKRHVQLQRYNQQQDWRSSSNFNPAQNRPYFYRNSNESWQQNSYQNDAYWQPPVPQNMHPMFNRSYGVSYNRSYLPQYGNYNSNNSDSEQNYQCAEPNFQSDNTYHYPAFSSMNHPQFSNVSYMNMPSCSTYMQQPSMSPMDTGTPTTSANAYWSSPVSPPSSSSTINATTSDSKSSTT